MEALTFIANPSGIHRQWFSEREITLPLYLSAQTVHDHASNVFPKLQLVGCRPLCRPEGQTRAATRPQATTQCEPRWRWFEYASGATPRETSRRSIS